MKTVLNLVPLYFLPFLVTFFPALMPRLPFVSYDIGQSVRVFFVDNTILPLLTNAGAWRFAAWYQVASDTQTLLLHLLVAVNITLLAGAVIFVIGGGYIRLNNFLVLFKIKEEEKEANR